MWGFSTDARNMKFTAWGGEVRLQVVAFYDLKVGVGVKKEKRRELVEEKWFESRHALAEYSGGMQTVCRSWGWWIWISEMRRRSIEKCIFGEISSPRSGLFVLFVSKGEESHD